MHGANHLEVPELVFLQVRSFVINRLGLFLSSKPCAEQKKKKIHRESNFRRRRW